MKRITYSINGDNQQVISETLYDENNNIIQSINHEEKPSVIKNYEYNQEGKLTYENEIQDDMEISSQTFEYNSKGEIIDQKYFISGALYEQIKLIKTEKGRNRVTIQDGEETERLEKIIDGKNWTTNFFYNKELLERHTFKFNEEKNESETIINNFEDDYNIMIKTKYNRDGEEILKEHYSKKGNLISSVKTERHNKLVIKESVIKHNTETHYENLYEYDDSGNQTNFEIRSHSGQLISFHQKYYDEQNRIIEEKGFISKNFNQNFMTFESSDQFHLVHKYDI